jgi:mannose/fructose/N-acetylgalactosamine-specific phosphotransferase system component IID
MDGQTERVNQILKTYLRLCVNYNQDDWASYLPITESAYNNTTHSSTTMSPFFVNKGYHLMSEVSLVRMTHKGGLVVISNIKALHKHEKQEIVKALERNEYFANQHHMELPVYAVVDHMCLSTRNLRTTDQQRSLVNIGWGRLGLFQ